jgi:hypothetical protein
MMTCARATSGALNKVGIKNSVVKKAAAAVAASNFGF